MEILDTSKAHPQALAAVNDAYRFLRAGGEETTIGVATDSLSRAATRFHDALKSIKPDVLKHSTRQKATVGYFLKMEQANCLVVSPDPSDVDKAIALYDDVLRESPRDATVHLRYARALRARDKIRTESGQVDLAKTQADLERGRDLLKRGITLIADDPLTGPDHWINLSMRIQLGFTFWSLAELSKLQSKTDDALSALRDAIAVTVDAYKYWNGLDGKTREFSSHKPLAHKAISNILYFGAAVVDLQKPAAQADLDLIRTYIDVYKSIPLDAKEAYHEFFKTRDNLMRAYQAIGEIETAESYAIENYGELRDMAEKIAGKGALHPDEIEAVFEKARGKLSPELVNFKSARAFLRTYKSWP